MVALGALLIGLVIGTLLPGGLTTVPTLPPLALKNLPMTGVVVVFLFSCLRVWFLHSIIQVKCGPL